MTESKLARVGSPQEEMCLSMACPMAIERSAQLTASRIGLTDVLRSLMKKSMKSGAAYQTEHPLRSNPERKNEHLAPFCHLNGMNPDLTTSVRYDFRIPSKPAPPPIEEPNPPENPKVP